MKSRIKLKNENLMIFLVLTLFILVWFVTYGIPIINKISCDRKGNLWVSAGYTNKGYPGGDAIRNGNSYESKWGGYCVQP